MDSNALNLPWKFWKFWVGCLRDPFGYSSHIQFLKDWFAFVDVINLVIICLSQCKHIKNRYYYLHKIYLFQYANMSIYNSIKKLFKSTYKKWGHTLHMTTDRPMRGQMHRLKYKMQASIQFNWPMVGQYDVKFIGIIQTSSY